VTHLTQCPVPSITAIIEGGEAVYTGALSIIASVKNLRTLLTPENVEALLPAFPDELLDDLEATFLEDPSLAEIYGIFQEFEMIFDNVTMWKSDLMDAYQTFYGDYLQLKQAYEQVQTWVDSLFGPRFDKAFPQKQFSCANNTNCGLYPASFADAANGEYSWQGKPLRTDANHSFAELHVYQGFYLS
jgi:hypothetical protein